MLANSHFARSISFAAGWTTLRVGLRLHMRNIGTDITGTPRFAFGLCSGTSNIFGDASVTHFVGALSSAASWTYGTGTPNYYYDPSQMVPAKKVGSTLTTGATFGQSVFAASAAVGGSERRAMMFVDITTGSPNYTLKLWASGTATIPDQSNATFLAQMENNPPSLANYTYSAGKTIAVNEGTDGTLNAINVSWDRTTPVIEICDIAVARIA